MPPLSTWFGGRRRHEVLRIFLAECPLSGVWRWKPIQVHGQRPAGARLLLLGRRRRARTCRSRSTCSPSAATRSRDVTAFITRSIEDPDPAVLARMPEQAFDDGRLQAAFGNFGLPERLD